jgi:hypothetical protein
LIQGELVLKDGINKPSAVVTFNQAATGNQHVQADHSLSFIIRTDANYALGERLRQNVFNHVSNERISPTKPEDVRAILDDAYATWGRNAISAVAHAIDLENYGMSNEGSRSINIHLHDAKFLSREVVAHARDYMEEQGKNNVVFVSLDEMIHGDGDEWVDVGFSRLFSHDGKQQGAFVGRPGKRPLDEQIADLRDRLIENKEKTGERPSFVFLEDNVRHARTINWIINEMDKGGVFEHGDLAAISTCFCCASEEEQAKINHKGNVIPVLGVVEYKDMKVDVITPRDLLFDGYVVEIEGGLSRLPALFMDVEKLFKVHPEKIDSFKDEVRRACVQFCDDVYSRTGYNMKVDDLTPAQAMCEILGCKPTDLVSDVIMAHSEREVKPAPVKNEVPFKSTFN